MAVATRVWLELMEREYLRGFIDEGGAAVKFVVGDAASLTAVAAELPALARRYGLLSVPIDAATTRLHMIQDAFFAVARAVEWDAAAQRYVEGLFQRQGYRWPVPGRPAPIDAVAEANGVDLVLLRRELRQWLTNEVMHDARMAQDFRLAAAALCLRRLEPEDGPTVAMAPVLEWLRGELRTIGPLKQVGIANKITRHNARAMLRSLCRWLRQCGGRGICVSLDIRRLGRIGLTADDGLRYSTNAVMDAFEVLRQLIDDADLFEGLLVVVLADESFVEGDPRRSLDAYDALKMRIWPDVHAKGRDNPLAPLVRLGKAVEGIDPQSLALEPSEVRQ